MSKLKLHTLILMLLTLPIAGLFASKCNLATTYSDFEWYTYMSLSIVFVIISGLSIGEMVFRFFKHMRRNHA
jgi:hypothetical protein